MPRSSVEFNTQEGSSSTWARRALVASLIFLPGGAPEITADVPKSEIAAVAPPASGVEEQQQRIGRLLFRWLSAPAEEPYPDDLPPIELPKVLDDTFAPNEILADCAREQDVACITIQGPGILECASLEEGDHAPVIVTDTSPIRRFFLGRENEGEDDQRFSMTMQLGPIGFADFTSPESDYELDLSRPSDVRLQLGLMCQSLVEDAHQTEFDADWFCGDEEALGDCEVRWNQSVSKARRIQEASGLVEDLELALLDLGVESVAPNSVFQEVSLYDAEGYPRTVQFSVVQMQTWTPGEEGFSAPTWGFNYRTEGFSSHADSPYEIYDKAEAFLAH